MGITMKCDCGYEGEAIFKHYGAEVGYLWCTTIICECPECKKKINIENLVTDDKT